jgi:uncharacterized protein (TIGR00369 family)
LSTVETLNAFMLRAPLHQWLGVRITAHDAATGAVRITLPARPELRHAPDRETVHGGIVAALVDLSAHAALNAVTGIGMPTIDLRTDYLRPALPPLEAVATPRRVGRTLGVVDIEVLDRDGKLAALGRVVYRTASE